MITINLLKRAASRRRRAGTSAGARFVRIGMMVIAGLAIVVAGAGLMRWLMSHPRIARKAAVPVAAAEPKVVPEQKVPPVTAAPQPQRKAPAAAVVPKTAPEKRAAPKKAAAVPVIPEKAAGAASPPAEPSLDDLSPKERIDYEITFAKNLFEVLTDAVPEGIEFGAITLNSFRTVTAVGKGPTREKVTALFNNLRRAGLNLLGNDDSYIAKGDFDGYTFKFACRPFFEKSKTGSRRSAVRLPKRKKLNYVLRSFSKIAKRDRLYLPRKMVRKKVKRSGGYRQYVYRFSCRGTYQNFAKFVLDLYKARLPCAFDAVRIAAVNEALVKISATVHFTMR